LNILQIHHNGIIMEKLKPTYELASITGNLSKLIFTNSALTGANEMGLTRPEMERVIVNFGNGDFHKSMTTHHDHKVWMDVYHAIPMVLQSISSSSGQVPGSLFVHRSRRSNHGNANGRTDSS